MKLNVSSSELLKGLMDISKAIPAKSALPILENFLFDLKGNILEVTASDSELTLRTEIEVDTTEEEGRIAVPARHIIDLLKEKKAEDIIVFGGGVIPETDVPTLLGFGAGAIFGPGTPTTETIEWLEKAVAEKRAKEAK